LDKFKPAAGYSRKRMAVLDDRFETDLIVHQRYAHEALVLKAADEKR